MTKVNSLQKEKLTLESVSSVNGYRITERKKENKFTAISMLKRATEDNDKSAIKRATRFYFCGSNKHILSVDNVASNLYTHRCKDRHCTECQAIKSYVWQKKITEILQSLSEEKKYQKFSFVFLTLTIKNPKVYELRNTLSLMNKAVNRMFKREKFKFVLGGVRSTEITRGQSGSDECHPHFHLLLLVPSGYFKGKGYLTSEQWGREWGDCLDLTAKEMRKKGISVTYNLDDYKQGYPLVDVKRAKDYDRKTNLTVENSVENGGQLVNYVLKYSVKGTDIIDRKKGSNDLWFFEYDQQIKGVRMITPVGLFREKLRDLEKPDFDFNNAYAEIKIKAQEGKAQVMTVNFDYNDDNYNVVNMFNENNKNHNELIKDALRNKSHMLVKSQLDLYYDLLEIHNRNVTQIIDTRRKLYARKNAKVKTDLYAEENKKLKTLLNILLEANDKHIERFIKIANRLCKYGYLIKPIKEIDDYFVIITTNDEFEIPKVDALYNLEKDLRCENIDVVLIEELSEMF
ncbi:protein rep [Escherichia coli]|nr:protein rep [Escherichia coli]EEW0563749.1 protein rep [Escherichia coli]